MVPGWWYPYPRGPGSSCPDHGPPRAHPVRPCSHGTEPVPSSASAPPGCLSSWVVVGVYLRHRRESDVGAGGALSSEPAQYFLTHRYLALFYSPALVLLPVALPLEKLTMQLVTRVLFIVVTGCLLTAVTTAFLVKSIRRVSHNGHKVPDSVEQDDGAVLPRVSSWCGSWSDASDRHWPGGLGDSSRSPNWPSAWACHCLSVRIPRPANLLLNPMVVYRGRDERSSISTGPSAREHDVRGRHRRLFEDRPAGLLQSTRPHHLLLCHLRCPTMGSHRRTQAGNSRWAALPRLRSPSCPPRSSRSPSSTTRS